MKPLDPIFLTERFVARPSITGNKADENSMAELIAEHLEQIGLKPGFWDTGEGRKSVWALYMRAPGDEFWILLSHFDTVGVTDYAAIPEANPFRSQTLSEAFARGEFGEEVAKDAASGKFIFGRGSLDMKSGIAAQISALSEGPSANVLFLSCPDEEVGSAGILTALERIKELASSEGLRPKAVINSDYTAPRHPGDTNRYLYLGTIGKLLPLALVAGVETHVGEPFRGLDACAMAAEIVSSIDMNADLCDRVGEEVCVPPVALRLRDLKDTYDVQTAFEAYTFFNQMTYCSSPAEVLSKIRLLVEQAVYRVAERRAASGESIQTALRAKVILYDELPTDKRQAAAETVTRDLRDHTDPRDVSLQIARLAAEWTGLERPYVLLLFAPPYYPHVQVTDVAFRNDMSIIAQRFGLRIRDFYPYISDLSYIGGAPDELHLESLAANLPQWGSSRLGYNLGTGSVRLGLGCPVANIGPWGKDAHGFTERVEHESIVTAKEAILSVFSL